MTERNGKNGTNESHAGEALSNWMKSVAALAKDWIAADGNGREGRKRKLIIRQRLGTPAKPCHVTDLDNLLGGTQFRLKRNYGAFARLANVLIEHDVPVPLLPKEGQLPPMANGKTRTLKKNAPETLPVVSVASMSQNMVAQNRWVDAKGLFELSEELAGKELSQHSEHALAIRAVHNVMLGMIGTALEEEHAQQRQEGHVGNGKATRLDKLLEKIGKKNGAIYYNTSLLSNGTLTPSMVSDEMKALRKAGRAGEDDGKERIPEVLRQEMSRVFAEYADESIPPAQVTIEEVKEAIRPVPDRSKAL